MEISMEEPQKIKNRTTTIKSEELMSTKELICVVLLNCVVNCELCGELCVNCVMLEQILKSPLDSKDIKPVIKEINPEYSLEGLMLKLKL